MSNTERLLEAALLCGLTPDGETAHRFQLYYVIQGHLKGRVGTQVLQRALETAATGGLFSDSDLDRTGRYAITVDGYREARRLFPRSRPVQRPAAPGGCVFELRAPPVGSHQLVQVCRDGVFETTLDGERISGPEAVRWVNRHLKGGIEVKGDSAPRRVFDWGVSQGWPMTWIGPSALGREVPGEGPSDPELLASLVASARQTQAAAIGRAGQVAFRQALLAQYGGKCAITGCVAADALEAAHIVPYHSEPSNQPRNGLLLRADIHTLFDKNLIRVNEVSRRILIDLRLQDTEYAQLSGRRLTDPLDPQHLPTDSLFATRAKVMAIVCPGAGVSLMVESLC